MHLGDACGPVRQLADHTPAGLRRVSTQKKPLLQRKAATVNNSRPVSATIPIAKNSIRIDTSSCIRKPNQPNQPIHLIHQLHVIQVLVKSLL